MSNVITNTTDPILATDKGLFTMNAKKNNQNKRSLFTPGVIIRSTKSQDI